MAERFPLNFLMRVDRDFLNRIDDWRRKQTDLPARAEAIRRLVERGLDDETHSDVKKD